MSSVTAVVRPPVIREWAPTSTLRRLRSAIPSWELIATKHLELRRRRGLMVAVVLLTLALPVLVLGFRLLFHVIDPSKYGPAGSPGLFSAIVNPMAEFGFIVAVAVGAAAGTTDLSDGVFRQLVVTGRSRIALFLARIPAGLGVLLPFVAIAFTMLCLVTAYAGGPQATSVNVAGVSLPLHLDQAQLTHWIAQHPRQATNAFGIGPSPNGHTPPAQMSSDYTNYLSSEASSLNPAINEMAKIGLWLSLVVVVGFTAGLGLGALTGGRTMSTIVMIAIEIIVTPILASHPIPYFLNGQRLFVGLALDQLRPAGLASGLGGGGGGPGQILSGGRATLDIPLMPTWAMILVIVGWVVGWSAIGAWKMARRDA